MTSSDPILDPLRRLHYLPTRLSKFVASNARLSHKKVGLAWREGEITVRQAGEDVLRSPGIQDYIIPGDDRVFLRGEPLRVRIPRAYYLLNKPEGVITTTSDPQGRACLDTWLEALPEGVFPVGRLDRATTGALFLTDDGDLAHLLLHPEFHVEKRYALHISTRRGEIAQGVARLSEGVDILDGKGLAQASCVEALEPGPVEKAQGQQIVHLTLQEGRNRQIRKMCQQIRLYLDHLHRLSFGPLHVHGMASGEVRELDAQEVEALWGACGGRSLVFERALQALERNTARYREEGEPNIRLESWLERYRR